MAKRPISTYDFLNYSYLSDPQISPDSGEVLFVVRQVGLRNTYGSSIWISSTTQPSPKPFTTGYNDRQPLWSPDGRRIVFLRGDGANSDQVYVIDRQGGEAIPLALFPEGKIGLMRWSPDGRWLALLFREVDDEWKSSSRARRRELGLSDPPRVIDTLWYRAEGEGYFGEERYALYLVDTSSGRASCVFNEDVLGTLSFDFSPDSTKMAITANRIPTAIMEPWNDELLILDIAKRQVTKLEGVSLCKKFNVRWSPNGAFIAFGGFLGQERAYCPDNVGLFVVDAQGGAMRHVSAQQDLCFQGRVLADAGKPGALDPNYLWSVDSKKLIASVTHHGQRHLVSIDVASEALRFETCGRYLYELGSASADGQTLAFMRSSATELPEVFVGRLKQEEVAIQQITYLNKECFSQLMVVDPEEHWVVSADGTKIQLWVMRPPEAAATDVTPAILDIHGGPHSCYGEGFRHDAQVLAAQGYTVVYPNVRGSKGYGSLFSKAIKRQWGVKDWQDLEATISFVQHSANIDKERLGILGTSYGGFLANWAVGHTSAFRAAVSDRAVCNLVSFIGTTDAFRPGDSFQHLWDCSPLKYVADVHTPTLILHGEGDLRVNIGQAEEWFTALRSRNIPSRFVRYPRNATHHMPAIGPPDLRLHRLEQIVMWFQSHLEAK